jgi:hypothetical protein
MNTQIVITPNQILEIFLSICGAIVAISAATTVIIKFIQSAKAPNKKQNERLDELEKKMKQYDSLFDNDNKRIKELEEGNRVTQQALLALLSHSINGNDTEKLVKARDDLQSYLIERGGIHHA